MTMFLALIALLLAFGALWFTSEIARKIDMRGQISINPNAHTLQESLRHTERQIRELKRGLQAAERKLQTLDTRNASLEGDYNELKAPETGQHRTVSTLDILRGAHKFYPSDTYKT